MAHDGERERDDDEENDETRAHAQRVVGASDTESVGTDVVQLSALDPLLLAGSLSRHQVNERDDLRASTLAAAEIIIQTSPLALASDSDYHLIELDDTNVIFYTDDMPIESPKDLLLSPEPLDANVGVRQRGLTSQDATAKLLSVAKGVLADHRSRLEADFSVKKYLSRCEVWGAVIMLVLLLASYLLLQFSELRLNEATPNPSSRIIVMILLALSLAWNTFLYYREMHTMLTEMSDRAHTVIEHIEYSGLNMVQEVKMPGVPSVTITRVVRDGVIRVFPTPLLVEGDIIELHYGDVAPCRCEYVFVSRTRSKLSTFTASTPQNNSSEQVNGDTSTSQPDTSLPTYILESSKGFRPTLFGIPPPLPIVLENQLNHGRYQFELLETPIAGILKEALTPQRPKSVIQNQLMVLEHFFLRKVLLPLLLCSFLVNTLRLVFAFAIHSTTLSAMALVPMLLLLPQVYAIIPLLLIPLLLPTLWLLFRNWSNAHLLTLWEALQTSKTEYEDDAEVDAFDEEAPPPTKDVVLARSAVMSRFLALLTKWDKNYLTRSTNLLESLGSMTVLCCLDREGTITASFPSVEQVVFPQDDKDITLDVTMAKASPTGVRFEDRDWQQYLPQLKPFGLVLLLCTNCGVLQGRRCTDHHRTLNNLHIHVKTRPARQCREIGFQDDVLRTLQNLKEIYTVSPYHPSLLEPIPDYEFEIPSCLSQIFRDQRSGTYQLMSVGSPETILDSCSDVWDGKSLRPFHDVLEKRMYDFYIASVANDCQVIAYAYRPITTENRDIPFLVDGEQDSFAYVEIPYRPNSGILYNEQPQRPLQQPLSSIITNSSTGESSAPESSLLSPLPVGTDTQASIETSQPGDTSTDFTPVATTPAAPRVRKPSARRHAIQDADDIYRFPDDITEDVQKVFYKDITKGQIFLGMATLKHLPKEDVCDVIEDIGLGGIRFVYFSPTGERQTKAFGEQLGLETDWNCCILLSSPNDIHASKIGYVEPHDIKAQLPRGISAIREHLQSVDDIPLHVSLFAESSPKANLEMIKIFQEYGEVVCCIGSALSDANTACFAQADVSVAIEPIRMRMPSFSARHESNASLPPLSIGASLLSLPCGLLMHSETSMYALTQLAREARRLCGSGRQGFVFLVGAQLSLSLYLVVSYCLLLPPVVSGYQALWVGWILLPLLSASFLFNPHEQDTMKIFTEKNIEHCKDLPRFVRYYAMRFLPAILMCIVLYIIAIVNLNQEFNLGSIYGELSRVAWLKWPENGQWLLVYSQNIALLAFVFYMIVISSTLLHRTESILSYRSYKNYVWAVMAVLCLGAQIVFCTISIASGPIFLFHQLPWYFWLLMIGWVLPLLAIQEHVTHLDKRQFVRFQKRSKLEFNTRLGMHSPV